MFKLQSSYFNVFTLSQSEFLDVIQSSTLAVHSLFIVADRSTFDIITVVEEWV